MKKILFLTAILLSVLSLSLACMAQETEKHVRVGYYNGDVRFQDGYSEDARKSGYAYEYYQKLAEFTGWIYTYIYGNRTEIMRKLRDGEVDIVAGIHKTDKLMDDFLFPEGDMGLAGDGVYFAVNKNRPDILAELEYAQKKIHHNDPAFELLLWQKHYSGNVALFMLSPSENEWLNKKVTLKAGYIRNDMPISDVDASGQPTGIAGELFERVENYLKIELIPISYSTITEIEDALAAGEIDFAFPIYYDLWVMEKKGFHLTTPVIIDNVMLAYKDTYNASLMDIIALCETGLGQKYYVEKYYPESKRLFFPTFNDCFDAVAEKKVNVVVGAASILQYFLRMHRQYRSFTIGYLKYPESFSLAVKRGDIILLNILNKLISQFSDTDITRMMLRYSNYGHIDSLYNVMQDNFITVISGLIILTMGVLFIFYKYRQRTIVFNQEQAKIKHVLEEALNAANISSNAKTSFLSNMSHDIRTPMNGIIGMTAIAMENINNIPKVRDCLNKISISSKHLLNLVNEVLDMAKIESGTVVLKKEPFNLVNLLDETMTINKPLAFDKDQNISIHINIKHEYLIGDSVRLQQVFTNIVGNAIKYTPKGGKITISCIEKDKIQPGYFEFIVEDNGIGMSKEYLPKLFDAFSRVRNALTSKIQGTGLGMPISRNIVRLMGGDIAVESEEGKGSTFTVSFFMALQEVEDNDAFQLSGLKVLIVNGYRDFSDPASRLLTEIGLKVDLVSAEAELMDKLEKCPNPDPYFAVMINLEANPATAIDIVKDIRSRFGNSLQIIGVHSQSLEEEMEARGAGFNGFLQLPLYKTRIVSLFHMLLESGKELEYGKNSTPDFTGKRALLVEDNELNAEIAMEILGSTGLAIDWAINGREALEKMAASSPGYYDCILMDVQMPVMNGLEATRAIRNLPNADAAKVPIIAMTANTFVDDITASLEAGMNEHVAKPLDFNLLFATLNKYFYASPKV